MPAPAPDVGHVDAGFQPPGETGHQWQDRVDQRGVVSHATVLSHQLLKPRVRCVRDAAAVAEAVDQGLLNLSQQRNELGLHRQVIGAGAPRQPCRVLSRQRVGVVGRVVVDHAAGQHGPQPLPDVAFVQSSRFRNLLTGRRRETRHGVEQTDLVADARHQRDARAVQHIHHALGESLGSCLVEEWFSHACPSLRWLG